MFRIECPTCETSYTNKRCGLKMPEPHESIDIVIECICGQTIRAFVDWTQPEEVKRSAWKFWRRVEQKNPELRVMIRKADK